MNDKVLKEMFINSGIVGKVIIGFCVFSFLFLSVFVWYIIQNTTTLQEIVRQNDNIEQLIQNQEKIDTLKKSIKIEYDRAYDYYNDEIIRGLGELLNEYGIAFPQKLNENLLKFRKRMDAINNCLIFSEKL